MARDISENDVGACSIPSTIVTQAFRHNERLPASLVRANGEIEDLRSSRRAGSECAHIGL